MLNTLIQHTLTAFDFFINACYYTFAMKYLEARPERASGEFTIKGTRIRIAMVINMLAHGFTLEELHTEHFPHVSIRTLRGGVEEATQYLSAQTNAEKIL